MSIHSDSPSWYMQNIIEYVYTVGKIGGSGGISQNILLIQKCIFSKRNMYINFYIQKDGRSQNSIFVSFISAKT